MTGVLLLTLAIVALLVASAFFSGSETALTAASEARMHALARRGNKSAAVVERLRIQKERLISSLLIGNNLVNVLATSLATSAFIAFMGEGGVLIATILMTLLLVLFAEVLPKTYAFHHANRMALFVVKPVHLLVRVLTPLTVGLNFLIQLFVKPRTGKDHDREEELRGLIALHGAGADDDETREQSAMLSSVLDLDDVSVDEVMTHRGMVEMVDADSSPEAAFKRIMKSPYTRHPVYSGKPDNIIGLLHVKDLLREISHGRENGNGPARIADVASEPYFILETTLLFDQLQAFRRRREHFAMVVDEYGDFQGVITLEDILEEIVGEIDDEHDVNPTTGIKLQSDGSWVVDGTVTIRDLNRAMEWDLPDEDAATVAGLVLNESRRIPEEGQEFHFHKIRFKVLRRVRNKLERIRISHPEQTEPPKAKSGSGKTTGKTAGKTGKTKEKSNAV